MLTLRHRNVVCVALALASLELDASAGDHLSDVLSAATEAAARQVQAPPGAAAAPQVAVTAAISADGIWEAPTDDAVEGVVQGRRGAVRRLAVARLNAGALHGLLALAPLEETGTNTTAVILTLPLPEGGFGRFRIEESPVLSSELAAAFPAIRTYRGFGVDDPAATSRLGWTDAGFHAMILSPAGSVYIDPAIHGDASTYVSLRKSDLTSQSAFSCQLHGEEAVAVTTEGTVFPIFNGASRRTYRLALAATAEYTALAPATVTHPAGSKEAALARMTATINRVNGIYDRDLAVRLTLSTGTAADPTALIFTAAATDGYNNSDGIAMLQENQTKLDAVIGSGSYDIGHVFSTGGGGVANLGSVCSATTKARGVTGSSNPTGDAFDVDFVAHEIGHQFGGPHTFNAESGNCNTNREAADAYEPGSGSTIMAYAGICDAADLQRNSHDYFHVESLNRMAAFLAAGGAACGTSAATGNSAPAVSAGTSRTVPHSTPFLLTATGSDGNGDPLTFTWEQANTGSASSTPATIASDSGGQPLFRSYPPSTDPTRTFPSLPFILEDRNVPPPTYSGSSKVTPVVCGSGTCATGEVLPATARVLKFQVTARDNRGGVASSSTNITVSATTGPFKVTSPNTAIEWGAATTETVEWDVAGTASAPVFTGSVRILLSTDGGLTFPHVLLSSTANDGSADVMIPNTPTTKARVKVEAISNIFFDISDVDFEIAKTSVQLALVVDDTGSMSEEIGAVRASLTNTIERLKGEAAAGTTPFPTVAILTFKDNVVTRVVSDTPSVLQGVVNSLFASGGSDCPEAANSALIAAGNLLSDNGVAMLFTDANSRADGPDRPAVLDVFRPKNIRLSVLLSGSCTEPLRMAGPGGTSATLGYADNHDSSAPRDASSLPAANDALLGSEGAIRTFSELSTETGGLFAAIPEVNFSADGATKYQNVATNLSVSAVTPAVALVTPATAPRGATITMDITGSNTNFQGSSAVTVSGSGVAVLSRTVVSPTRILALVAVDPSAATDFRDVTVTTNLGAGTIESALGGGSLRIVSAPTTAQVVGITPWQVPQGRTVDVKVDGVNTTFGATSTLNLGAGITVNSITASGPRTLQANITVSPTATIGFRNVTVTSFTEVAGESVVGPLMVTAPPPVIPRILSTTPASGKRGRQRAVAIVGENTSFAAGVTTVSFSGTGVTVEGLTVTGPTSLLAIVSVSRTAALGFRDITATTGTETAVLLSSFNVTDPVAFPEALVFGATKNGAAGPLQVVTQAQEVTVSYTGMTSTTAWTATADQPWVRMSGVGGVGSSAGTGAGRFTVSISDPTNSIGMQTDLTATVTISLPGAGLSETMPVRLLVQQSTSSSSAPFGQVDTPTQNATDLTGAVALSGWAMDDVGIKEVRVYRGCVAFEAALTPSPCGLIGGNLLVHLGNATIVTGARPDLELAFPGMPAANRAGWGLMVLTNMLPHIPTSGTGGGQGTFSFYVYAHDEEGQATLLGRSTSDHAPTTVTLTNDVIAKPFGTIDTPAQGGTMSGQALNFGWLLTPDSNTIADSTDILMPLDGSRVTVFVDGNPVGTITYDLCRGTAMNPLAGAVHCDDDVASIFGNVTAQPPFTPRVANPTRYRNLDAGRGPIGFFRLDTTTLTNGLHTIAWGVTDTAGRAEGIGSRFFHVLNASATRASEALVAEAPVPNALRLASGSAGKPPAADPVYGRTGYDLETAFVPFPADASGVHSAAIPEMGRLELRVPGVTGGIMRVGDEARELPVGLRVDPASGTITWVPGPGYLGTYRLEFERESDRVVVDATVGATDAAPPVRMHIDTPLSGSTQDGWVTVAGWALDRMSPKSSAVGAVHVWATPRGGSGDSRSAFLGTATLNLARPDVAAAFGAGFDRTGFSLSAALAPGEYDIAAYVWLARTGRFEDARTVRVVVR